MITPTQIIENDYWKVLVAIANRRPYGSTFGGNAFLRSRNEAREVLKKHCGHWRRADFKEGGSEIP